MPLGSPAIASSRISIHVPREGHDRLDGHSDGRGLGISIHVPREGHDQRRSCTSDGARISIHVPREGHDTSLMITRQQIFYFNPRAPRGARRRSLTLSGWTTYKFQSTCPARGTTAAFGLFLAEHNYFNPRAPRGARHCSSSSTPRAENFNPRAPRGARRSARYRVSTSAANFNPRAPRGARPIRRHCSTSAAISIHVPREGHDSCVRASLLHNGV